MHAQVRIWKRYARLGSTNFFLNPCSYVLRPFICKANGKESILASVLNEHRVVVVGAGVAGLVAALQLAQRNLQVTLVEAAATPGGKMRQPLVDGAAIDSGPTVFTMRWIFEQIFLK